LNAAVVTIGDEILIGQIVDTNSAWMGRELNAIGWEIREVRSIPDDADAILETLAYFESKVEVVLMTGGLGPTKDDITKKTLCRYFDSELEFNAEVKRQLEERFKQIGRTLNEANLTQAMLPKKSTVLYNSVGTAPGMLFSRNGTRFVSMPGVPYEMRNIMQEHVLPMLDEESDDLVEHRTLVTANVPESELATKLREVEEQLPKQIKLAYLPHFNYVRLRLTGRAKNSQELTNQLEQAIAAVKHAVGKHIIHDGDIRIEELVGKLLHERQETLTIAESCTGGRVANLITSVPGSSAYFPGSVVTYSYDNKSKILDVDSDVLWKKGAVSEEVVLKMATSARELNDATYALSLSGIAGPGGGTPSKPVGTVWIAVASQHGVFAKEFRFSGNREKNIEFSAHVGLELVRKMILGELRLN
jgi:nicotinamide-nucleotide amidase